MRPALVIVVAGAGDGAGVGDDEAGAGDGAGVGDDEAGAGDGDVGEAAGGKTHCDAAGGEGEEALQEALGGADMTG